MWMAQAIQAIMELDLWFVFFQFDKSNLLPPQYYKGEFNFICKVHIILKKSLLKKVTTAHLIPEIGLITDELGQSLLWTVIWVSRPFSLIFVPISPACVIIFRHLVSSAVLAPCCNPSITIVMLFFLTSWLSFHEMFSYVHWVFIQPVWHNNLHFCMQFKPLHSDVIMNFSLTYRLHPLLHSYYSNPNRLTQLPTQMCNFPVRMMVHNSSRLLYIRLYTAVKNHIIYLKFSHWMSVLIQRLSHQQQSTCLLCVPQLEPCRSLPHVGCQVCSAGDTPSVFSCDEGRWRRLLTALKPLLSDANCHCLWSHWLHWWHHHLKIINVSSKCLGNCFACIVLHEW